MTLTEFLLARIAEDEAMDRSLAAKAKAVARAGRFFGSSDMIARQFAQRFYANHPDYRDEWRP